MLSIIASAVRPKIWHWFLDSLITTSVPFEVVFAGNTPREITNDFEERYPEFRYIQTGNIKPAQCYEVARRYAIGKMIVWAADDCEFPHDILGEAYDYWKSKNNEKLILSLQTKESGYNLPKGQLFDMNNHRFFGNVPGTPLMAPLGMMSSSFLQDLGGFDRRYICGQYENDVVMRAYQQGASVEIFGGPELFVDIDHYGKSLVLKESTDQESFLKRPFASSYKHDRTVLEQSWTTFNPIKAERILRESPRITLNTLREVSSVQLDKFEPYEHDDILTKSQGPKGQWEE